MESGAKTRWFTVKILISSTYFEPYRSGLSVYAFRLAEGLANLGHQVRVLTSQYQPDLPAHEELGALQKLAAHALPGEDAALRQVFLDNIVRLDAEALQQRREELQARIASLDEAEKAELRDLLQARLQR